MMFNMSTQIDFGEESLERFIGADIAERYGLDQYLDDLIEDGWVDPETLEPCENF